jgi:hypothetical protein
MNRRKQSSKRGSNRQLVGAIVALAGLLPLAASPGPPSGPPCASALPGAFSPTRRVWVAPPSRTRRPVPMSLCNRV